MMAKAAVKKDEDEVIATGEQVAVNEGAAAEEQVAAMNEDDAALIAAGEQAEEALKKLGIAVKENATERPRLSPEEYQARARARSRQQRESGKKMLETKRAGINAVNKKVSINNRRVAGYFQEFYPVVDLCLDILRVQGAYRLGEERAEELTTTIVGNIEKAYHETLSGLAALKEVVSAIASRPNFLQPSYTQSAYEVDVQVKHPMAMKMLDVVNMTDEMVALMDTLYWNGERMESDVNDVVLSQRKLMYEIFALAGRTLAGMRRALQARQQREAKQTAAHA